MENNKHSFEYYRDLAELELMLDQYGIDKLLEMIDYVKTEEWKDDN
jgi:hypothetical protein